MKEIIPMAQLNQHTLSFLRYCKDFGDLLFWILFTSLAMPTKTDSKKTKTLWPFLWMGFNCLKGTESLRGEFTFNHLVPRNSWHSVDRPRKDGRLSRPWSHPVVFNTGPLNWESSALTTRRIHIV